VKVLDFGLVKVLDETDVKLTADGATTGTPAYMAPEMALGNPCVDGRTDLYGLGCVAYWLITGGLVFEEKNATAMMLAHLHKVPVVPSARSELKVPASLDRAIMTCLAKDLAGRPADAEILDRVLENCACSDSWTAEDAERWWRIHLPQDVGHVRENARPVQADPNNFPTL
jgi:eukaryotic-like serine/threonine-protein kinase